MSDHSAFINSCFENARPGLCTRSTSRSNVFGANGNDLMFAREDPSLQVQPERPELVQPDDGARHRSSNEFLRDYLHCFCVPSKDLLVSRRLASAHGIHTRSNARGQWRRQSIPAPLVPVRCRRRARSSVERCRSPHGQMLTFRNPRDLLVAEPAAFMELLEAARPAPVSMEDMGAILRALPPEGEVTKLGAPAQQKVDAVRQLLKATQRDWYEIKVIDLPQAGDRPACSRPAPDFRPGASRS